VAQVRPMTHLEDRGPNTAAIRHFHSRGLCPHCRRPLELGEPEGEGRWAACTRCGHRVLAQKRSGLLRRLRERMA